MEKQRKWSGWVLIALIVIVSGTALVFNTLADPQTGADPDLQQNESILRQFFPDAGPAPDGFERLDTDGQGFVYAVKQGGNVLGHAVRQTVKGYGGPIEVTVGFDPQHVIRGIHVGGAEFQETEGLGARAREPAFTDQFQGQVTPLALGQQVDAISGATVTSQAVVDAVNQAMDRLAHHIGITAPVPSSNPVGSAQAAQGQARTANASVIGYGGPVLARVTLNADGAIESVEFGGARFLETDGVGSRVRDEASFAQSFVGKTPPLTLGQDVDALSGATISSQAALDAVNEAYAFLTEKPEE